MADKSTDFLFAKVAAKYSDGVALLFPGEEQPTEKHYKCNSAAPIRVGDTVKITKSSGTYVIEYPVGAPATLKSMNKCPSTATNAQLAEWINTIISGLADLGLMEKNNW